MSRVNKFASQPISDALIDDLADLLYEAAIRSCTPRRDIRRIVGDFLEDYRDADQVLCSVCKETKTDYIRQQWQMIWLQVARRIQQQEPEDTKPNMLEKVGDSTRFVQDGARACASTDERYT